MGTLTLEVGALGLAVAFTSPGSVVTVIVLLSMSSGVRRAIAFIIGWILAIGLLALLLVFVLHGQDFSSKHTTPSQTASGIEIALGCLLLLGAARVYRKPGRQTESQATPKWLDRVEGTPWIVGLPVGVVMCSYTLTLAAGAEILKAKVGVLDAAVASLVFAILSIVTIAAPVALVLAAPDSSAQMLATWKAWLIENSRAIALIALTVIGVFLIVRGAYDLAT